MAGAATDAPNAHRMLTEVDRLIQRNIKGLTYFGSPHPTVGATPKDLIHGRGTMNLYRYRPQQEEVYRVPVLFVMSTTNRGYIFDLTPGRSFIEFLLQHGYDVYVLDWNPPRPDESQLTLEDYVLDFIPDCVERVARRSGEPDLSIIGYCMGGLFSVIYAALTPGGPLKNLVSLTTPIDFEQMSLFRIWADARHFDVDRLVDTLGNAPPEVIFSAFHMLRPASRTAGQIQLWDNIWNDEYVKSYRMFDRWATDILPQPGEYFRQSVKELLRENRLYRGTLEVGGRRVDLANIKVPLLNVIAEHDHTVSLDCAKPLVQLAGSQDKEEVVLKGGHVSVVAGPNAVKRLWPKIDQWLGERSL